jgi:hypothetical protein
MAFDTVIAQTDAPFVAIYVDSVHHRELIDDLNDLSRDLNLQGFSVLRYAVARRIHPAVLRDSMRLHWQQYGVEGALFIGQIQSAWFQVRKDHDSTYDEWPCDLFFMDLDGEWRDDSIRAGIGGLGQDDIYESHTGDVAPEIYVGRLMPSGLTSSSTGELYRDKIRMYLAKAHAFRTNRLRLPDKALFFLDDPWVRNSYWLDSLKQAYPDAESYIDSAVDSSRNSPSHLGGGSPGPPRQPRKRRLTARFRNHLACRAAGGHGAWTVDSH